MKIGMIFECAREGPDKKVCEHLARQINPNIDIDGVTLDNKPRLIEDCGITAARLLATGCARVVIVWDLRPFWNRAKGGCVAEDCMRIRAKLAESGVAESAVHLVCIVQELEAWLLADERAVARVLRLPTSKIKRVKKPEIIPDPKTHLDNIFRNNERPPYNAHVHAHKIALAMEDFGRLKGCPAFARFQRAVSGS